MTVPPDVIRSDRSAFESDPFGYAALGWHRWGMVQISAGFPVDLEKGPSDDDLKSPVLWLLHAQAMSEAARSVIQSTPNFGMLPQDLQGISRCQYHAVALMLVGYSLEICLKAMLIIKKGIAGYQADEKKHSHHNLGKLADFIPDLSEKDKAILSGLTHFVKWAGRYPDPGTGKTNHAEDIFTLAEQHQISAKDLFNLAARVMGHSHEMLGSEE